MYKSLDSGKKAGMISLMIITIITIGIASAAPLEIVIEEKVSTTAEESSYGQPFSYQTTVKGYINITNNAQQDTIYDIWVAINLVNNSTDCNNLNVEEGPNYATVILGATVPSKIDDYFDDENANCIVHITSLRPDDKVSLSYDVDVSTMGINDGAPFTITETYSPSKIPARGNYTWRVTMQAQLNTSWFEKTAIDLTGKIVFLDIKKFLSKDPDHHGSNNWESLGPISNPPSEGNLGNDGYGTVKPDTLTITGKQLSSSNPSYSFSFDVTGYYNNQNAAPYYFEPFGFAVFSFEVEGNISGTQIVDVFAIGNASVEVTKDGPYQDSNGDSWWRGNATITNKAQGLTYVLTKVTMWATETGSFNQFVSGQFKCRDSGSQQSGYVICEYYDANDNILAELTPGSSYTVPGSNDWMNFSYSQVPIIWANATFKLVKGANGWDFSGSKTLNDTNATYGSNFIVIEKIYIIGTYLVKVTKHVMFNKTDNEKNVFDIYLVVENIGGNESPYVYVYDLIPQNFEEYNWNDSWTDPGQDGNWVNKSSMFAGNGSETLSNFLGTYTKGHYWRLMPIAPGANGDGNYEDWQEISDNKTVVIFYQIDGTGDFKVLDAFIVGIDPMYSLNEQTAPKITLVSGAKMTNYETTLATITFASMGALLVIYIRRNGRNGA
ncbi:MAG: hypothetical protein QXP28_01965 [Archaeoglobaceae archaeon]